MQTLINILIYIVSVAFVVVVLIQPDRSHGMTGGEQVLIHYSEFPEDGASFKNYYVLNNLFLVSLYYNT